MSIKSARIQTIRHAQEALLSNLKEELSEGNIDFEAFELRLRDSLNEIGQVMMEVALESADPAEDILTDGSKRVLASKKST